MAMVHQSFPSFTVTYRTFSLSLTGAHLVLVLPNLITCRELLQQRVYKPLCCLMQAQLWTNAAAKVQTCMSLRPPAAAAPAGGVAPEPAAVLPDTGGTAAVGGSAAAALAAVVLVDGAPTTGLQLGTVGRLGSALVAASFWVKGAMMSVKTVLLDAAKKGTECTSALWAVAHAHVCTATAL